MPVVTAAVVAVEAAADAGTAARAVQCMHVVRSVILGGAGK